MPYMYANEIDLYYEEYGDPEAPALILAHGAGGNHLVWWQQVPVLAERYRVVTFDHRAFGFSKDVPGGPGRRAFSLDLHALLAHLEIDQFAHSPSPVPDRGIDHAGQAYIAREGEAAIDLGGQVEVRGQRRGGGEQQPQVERAREQRVQQRAEARLGDERLDAVEHEQRLLVLQRLHQPLHRRRHIDLAAAEIAEIAARRRSISLMDF